MIGRKMQLSILDLFKKFDRSFRIDWIKMKKKKLRK